MAFSSPYPPETRTCIEGMLRETALSMNRIAARTGIPYATVWFWNRKAGIRPGRHGVGQVVEGRPAVVRWKPSTRKAKRRRAKAGPPTRGAGARARTKGHRAASRSRPVHGLAAGTSVGLRPPGDVPDLAALDAALRVHIARQIAAFDDRLQGAGADIDTAKVLRDLGGLKRLLDGLGAAARQPDCDGDADGGSPQDLAALRDRLARRIEAFVAQPPDTAAAGNPGP